MRARVFSNNSIWPSAAARLLGSSIVSIFCIGIAHPAMSTIRRFPYSSYFPSQTSSVFSCESGCGLAGPKRTFSDIIVYGMQCLAERYGREQWSFSDSRCRSRLETLQSSIRLTEWNAPLDDAVAIENTNITKSKARTVLCIVDCLL